MLRAGRFLSVDAECCEVCGNSGHQYGTGGNQEAKDQPARLEAANGVVQIIKTSRNLCGNRQLFGWPASMRRWWRPVTADWP
jgi:hypothetical protein